MCTNNSRLHQHTRSLDAPKQITKSSHSTHLTSLYLSISFGMSLRQRISPAAATIPQKATFVYIAATLGPEWVKTQLITESLIFGSCNAQEAIRTLGLRQELQYNDLLNYGPSLLSQNFIVLCYKHFLNGSPIVKSGLLALPAA